MFKDILCPLCSQPLKRVGKGIQCATPSCPGSKGAWSLKDKVVCLTEDSDDGFDTRWLNHPRPQAQTEQHLRMKTGWEPKDVDGKTILDAGCGVGRFIQVLLAWGAKHVVGVDCSPTGIQAARENLAEAIQQDRVTLIRADLTRPYLAPGSVDMALSIGVLHHTPDPAGAFRVLAKIPRESLAVWVYTKHVSDDRWLPVLEMFHEITKGVPPQRLYEIFQRLAPRVRDAYNKEWGALQQILRVSNQEDDSACISDTMDWHSPEYRSWHTPEEVRGWFAEAGYQVDRTGEFPVSVRGFRATMPGKE
ncbi:MAG: class I SAM-dependent methyltransferase [Deltaproteobacteria bacterium]|nr:class I SAM-dependent methyltransferase [Deltaproteobacteria bacterium]